jgi:hypothetical protein
MVLPAHGRSQGETSGFAANDLVVEDGLEVLHEEREE